MSWKPTIDRLQDLVELGPGGCWDWRGKLNAQGYGVWRSALAHRVAYALYHGPIPKGLVVRHHCDRPRCVNPSHLAIGTREDNVADRVERGRSARGERHGRAKLTDWQAREIATCGEPVKAMARRLGVTPKAVRYWRKKWQLEGNKPSVSQ